MSSLQVYSSDQVSNARSSSLRLPPTHLSPPTQQRNISCTSSCRLPQHALPTSSKTPPGPHPHHTSTPQPSRQSLSNTHFSEESAVSVGRVFEAIIKDVQRHKDTKATHHTRTYAPMHTHTHTHMHIYLPHPRQSHAPKHTRANNTSSHAICMKIPSATQTKEATANEAPRPTHTVNQSSDP